MLGNSRVAVSFSHTGDECPQIAAVKWSKALHSICRWRDGQLDEADAASRRLDQLHG
jgi:hypothetical protein